MPMMLNDGALIEGTGTIEVHNPATGLPFATAPRADRAIVDRAVAAALAAQPGWAALGCAERGRLLQALADALEARSSEFVRLLVQEQGKPTPEAEFEVGGSVAALRTFAAMDLPLKLVRESASERIYEQRSPLGVVVAITPWNFPLLLLVIKLGPALFAGNTVIAKPAPTTPLTTLLLGEVAADILPRGVLATIVDDNDLGAVLTEHPGVAKVSFTGSSETGRKVVRSSAGTLKRVTLELGGNDAAIVLDDVDVDEVAPKLFQAAMVNAGQVCLAAKRVYAPRALYDRLVEALAALAREAIVDDGDKQGTQIGPVQNRRQYEKLTELLEDTKAHGKIVAGGDALDREGWFIAPTVVRDLPHTSRLVREEQFGPIMPVIAYDDLEEVIRLANDSEYGLGGTVWTGDPERGLAVALRIETGTVWVNKHLDLPFDVPFGGAKQSGFGREMGYEGLLEFTQPKIINMALS